MMIEKKKPECNKCGLDIGFKRVLGKWTPVNIDGSDHWDICKTTVNIGTKERSSASPWIVGANYVYTKCDCLPWDGCENCAFDKDAFKYELTHEQSHIRDICQG